jgi:hypothetical protein
MSNVQGDVTVVVQIHIPCGVSGGDAIAAGRMIGDLEREGWKPGPIEKQNGNYGEEYSLTLTRHWKVGEPQQFQGDIHSVEEHWSSPVEAAGQ